MPKLPKAIQKAADDAKLQDFSALPAGLYLIRVTEVKTDGQSSNKNPMWTLTLEVEGGPNDLTEDKHKGRKLWENLVLTEAAAWKVKQVFNALGFTMDSDADEFLNERAVVQVTQREIEQGNRKGEMGNNITRWASADDAEASAPVAASDGEDDY
ncbi:MAG TPA: DUF669 domain-containing protein [Actinomycetota bacterium]|nr:DUF669 domain-containing protein [Actinomycetota bacterium]